MTKKKSWRDCFWHAKPRLSTYTPVYLHDRISVQAVLAFTTERRRSEQSCVNLDEGEEEQERSFRIPVKQYWIKSALLNQALLRIIKQIFLKAIANG